MNKDKSLIPAILVAAVLISGSLVFAGLHFSDFNSEDFRKAVRTEITAYVQDQQKAYEEAVAKQQAQQEEKTTVEGDFTGEGAMIGQENAPVTIVEFSEFQCPYCRVFINEAYQDIKKNFIETGKAKLVFRHLPLSFHPDAYGAAMAAECAREQGGDKTFFTMHDKIFGGQSGNGTNPIPTDTLYAYAKEMKLDTTKFEKCVTDETYKDLIEADVAAAKEAGINGTPGFIINGTIVSGARPYAYFETIINEALAATEK